ncbi:meiotic recombination protein REC114-like [Ciona intestinalis]
MDAHTNSMQQRSVHHFPLLKYCRAKQNPEGMGSCSYADARENWITQEASETVPMVFSVSNDGHLIVTSGNAILESIYTAFSSEKYTSAKAYRKKDALLVLYKAKEESRMFRLQVCTINSNADAIADSCAKILSKFIPVRFDGKSSNVEPQPVNPVETSLAEIAQNVVQNTQTNLPMLYQACNFQCSEADSRELNEFVRLCLTDPTFPSYVGKVEEILQNIAAGNKE